MTPLMGWRRTIDPRPWLLPQHGATSARRIVPDRWQRAGEEIQPVRHPARIRAATRRRRKRGSSFPLRSSASWIRNRLPSARSRCSNRQRELLQAGRLRPCHNQNLTSMAVNRHSQRIPVNTEAKAAELKGVQLAFAGFVQPLLQRGDSPVVDILLYAGFQMAERKRNPDQTRTRSYNLPRSSARAATGTRVGGVHRWATAISRAPRWRSGFAGVWSGGSLSNSSSAYSAVGGWLRRPPRTSICSFSV